MFFFGISDIFIAHRNRGFGLRITDIACKGTKKKLYVQEIRRKSVILPKKTNILLYYKSDNKKAI